MTFWIILILLLATIASGLYRLWLDHNTNKWSTFSSIYKWISILFFLWILFVIILVISQVHIYPKDEGAIMAALILGPILVLFSTLQYSILSLVFFLRKK